MGMGESTRESRTRCLPAGYSDDCADSLPGGGELPCRMVASGFTRAVGKARLGQRRSPAVLMGFFLSNAVTNLSHLFMPARFSGM
jgi:hypothetical protein